MAMVQRWQFHDPYASPAETWTVPINPREMDSPFFAKNVTSRVTTAVNGQALMFEGAAEPHEWTFSGAILTAEHYAELKRWVDKNNRVRITDHFGRTLEVYLLAFAPTPKRSLGKYWRHEYTVRALVTKSPTAPTVGV
jgi:hypothetical protein